GIARRITVADLRPRGVAVAVLQLDHWFFAGVCARVGRIRVRRVRVGQYAVQDGDCPGADCLAAGGIRLRRSDRDRTGAGRRVGIGSCSGELAGTQEPTLCRLVLWPDVWRLRPPPPYFGIAAR